MPGGLIGQHDGVRARRDLGGDFGQAQVRDRTLGPSISTVAPIAIVTGDSVPDPGPDGTLALALAMRGSQSAAPNS